MTTAKLGLTETANGQANYLNVNDALAKLDQLVQGAVLDKDLAAPPGSPANGAAYIVAASPTDTWAGQAGKIAYWLSSVGVWTFVTPREGFFFHVNDENAFYSYDGSVWAIFTGAGMANPMTTAGDLIVGGASGAPTRLPKGADDQFLKVVGGVVSWGAASGGGSATFAPVIDESTTARTLALTDAGVYLRHTNASASTVTVAPQSSVAWAVDTEVHVRRAAAGKLTLTAGAGVTLNAPSGGTLVMTNNMSVTLKRVAADIWDVIGQTVPA